MVSTASTNTLGKMLDNAFAKFDRDKNGKLDAQEFQSFNEILKPGIAIDASGKPTVDYQTEMDSNGDGEVSQSEMDTTGVLMPASLTDTSLGAMLSYLTAQKDAAAAAAAAIIAEGDISKT